MSNKAASGLLILLVAVCGLSFADPVIRCPSGYNVVNDDTQKVLFDYRDWQTCTDGEKTSCAVTTYSYRLPCDGCQGDKVSGWTYMPCVNHEDTMKWIAPYSGKDSIITALPHGAEYIESGYVVCDQHPCFDFTKPGLSGLTCNQYAITKDDVTDDVIANYDEPAPTTQCKSHQNKCVTMEISFVDQETKTPATVHAGGCWDNYRHWFDRYFPHASKDEKYCEQHGCHNYPTGCMCYGDNKLEGKGQLVETLCDTDLCN